MSIKSIVKKYSQANLIINFKNKWQLMNGIYWPLNIKKITEIISLLWSKIHRIEKSNCMSSYFSGLVFTNCCTSAICVRRSLTAGSKVFCSSPRLALVLFRVSARGGSTMTADSIALILSARSCTIGLFSINPATSGFVCKLEMAPVVSLLNAAKLWRNSESCSVNDITADCWEFSTLFTSCSTLATALDAATLFWFMAWLRLAISDERVNNCLLFPDSWPRTFSRLSSILENFPSTCEISFPYCSPMDRILFWFTCTSWLRWSISAPVSNVIAMQFPPKNRTATKSTTNRAIVLGVKNANEITENSAFL